MDRPTKLSPREILLEMWNGAVRAVSVDGVFRDYLPPKPKGKIVVVGAGKAAAAMAAATAAHYGTDVEGVVVTRNGHGLKEGETAGLIRIIEARHPVPDSQGLEAGTAVLRAVERLSADDLVLCLLSGGGSALLEKPLPGITLEEIKALNERLLASGAAIAEMNCVRKHLSSIKAGRLAIAAWPAHVVTLAISDVPGDDPSVIASGPTVPDPTTGADAAAVLEKYGIPTPPKFAAIFADQSYETPKASDPRLANAEYRLVATQADALDAATKIARSHGFAVVNRGTRIEGEAKVVAREEAEMALRLRGRGNPLAIIGGGELTVTLEGRGSGGPNREYALALAIALNGDSYTWALAADTDGIDGSSDGAGAIVTPDTLSRAKDGAIDPEAALGNHDSGAVFASLGDAIVTGPTRTNVSDFRALLVMPR